MSNTRTKVAIVLPELLPVPPVRGGAVEQWVHIASQKLVETGVDLTIVSRPAGVEGLPHVNYVGVPWTKLSRSLNDLKGRLPRRNPIRTFSKIQNVWSYGRRIASSIALHDVVCIENEPNLLFFVRKRHGQRIVLHMHNEHLGIRFLKPFYRRALKKVDLVICVSDYIKRRAVASYPEHADKFVVLLNAVDAEFFHPIIKHEARHRAALPSEIAADPLILYVGRIIPEKGVHILLAAFADVLRRVPTARLVIVGSSFFGEAAKTTYQQELSKAGENYGEKVYFTGFLGQEAVRDLYAAADVIVAPAIWQEPCALVVLEAMSSGTPLVATSTGGTPELILDSANGMMVAPQSVDDLADAIVTLLSDKELAASMGNSARAHVIARHQWSDLITRFKKFLEGKT